MINGRPTLLKNTADYASEPFCLLETLELEVVITEATDIESSFICWYNYLPWERRDQLATSSVFQFAKRGKNWVKLDLS